MKQKVTVWMIGMVLGFVSLSSFAQETQNPVPRWVSSKGYWVVESNLHSPLNHTVWFYTNDNVLVYKEVISGIKLNPGKRKVKMKLKKVLEASVLAWEQSKTSEENKEYLAAILQ